MSETNTEQLMLIGPPVYWCDGPSENVCDLESPEEKNWRRQLELSRGEGTDWSQQRSGRA